MHPYLAMLYAATDGSHFSAEHCALVVRELAKLELSSIPNDQTSNVLEFLNKQLLHQQVDDEILKLIEDLAAELAIRLATTKVSLRNHLGERHSVVGLCRIHCLHSCVCCVWGQ